MEAKLTANYSSALKPLLATLVLLTSCVSVRADGYTLDDVQGYWWESCDDPAAQFAIQQNRYFGDFEGQFEVRVQNSVLIVERKGDTNLSYRIVSSSSDRLVLRSDLTPEQDWTLRSCPSSKPN